LVLVRVLARLVGLTLGLLILVTAILIALLIVITHVMCLLYWARSKQADRRALMTRRAITTQHPCPYLCV
jgi:hypothetical protein